MTIGSNYIGQGRCEFVVWAPHLNQVGLQLLSSEERTIPLERDEKGYWRTTVQNLSEETLYRFNLDGKIARPDPASHWQPHGVHQCSKVVNHASHEWYDPDWQGIDVAQMIMYELYVGTFTSEGTFDAIIPRLSTLSDIGINAIELMPIAQFPGERNWGYDGVYPFAAQHSYGGPAGLKRLVKIGNRMRGERMSSLVSFEGAKLHAAITLLSPFVPLIFTGEEYAEVAPFKYFVSRSNEQLIEAVRKGRREVFESFDWQGELPDPQSEREFLDSTLDWSLRSTGKHRSCLNSISLFSDYEGTSTPAIKLPVAAPARMRNIITEKVIDAPQLAEVGALLADFPVTLLVGRCNQE